MTGYEAYGIFTALKLHFNKEKYDYFKYDGKVRVTLDAFENKKDKYHYYKLSRKKDNKKNLEDFIVANLMDTPEMWVGGLLDASADAKYLERRKVNQSLSYFFENDCKKLFNMVDSPDDLVKVPDGDYPLLLKMVKQREVEVETLCLLNRIGNFMPMWTKKITDTIVWPSYRLRYLKYAAFMPQDDVKYKLILRKVINKSEL